VFVRVTGKNCVFVGKVPGQPVVLELSTYLAVAIIFNMIYLGCKLDSEEQCLQYKYSQ